jgi:small nuclear ribonucleoprotein (snRNP)-like protein
MRLFPASGPAAVCSALLFLSAAGTISAVQVKLNNGTVLVGDIVDQNENFIVVQVGQAKLSIVKNTVSEIIGQPAGAPAAGPSAAPARSAAAGGTSQGRKVEVSLRYGSKFVGTIAAMDDKVMELVTENGSRVVLYKVNITDVRDLSEPAPAAAPVAAPAAPVPHVQTAVPAPAPLAAPAEAVPGKMVEITLKSGAKFKGTVTSADDRHIMLEVARGSTLDFYRQVIVAISDLSVAGVPAASPAQASSVPPPPPAPAPVIAPEKPAPAPAAPVATAPVPAPVVAPPAPPPPAPAPVIAPEKPAPAPAAPVATAPLPAPVAAPPAPQPIPVIASFIGEGKNELKLKNGTTLRGATVSSNDWYIVFSVAGVTVNILRRLVAAVDGAANADTMMPARGSPAAPPAPDRAAAVAELVKALADPSAETRQKSVSALGAMGDTIAVLPLAAALRDSDGAVRMAAAEALGDLRDPRAILPLCAALQERVDAVAAAVRFSLKLHTEIPLLIGALDNQNSLVRENAALVLWLMTGKNFGNDKQGWVDWYAESRGAK